MTSSRLENVQNPTHDAAGPRFSFVMIVLNGLPFIEYSLKCIYNFAHEIIIVEGAVKDCRFAADANGGSTDGTVEFIKRFPDPQNKIRLIRGTWPEKCEMQNKALEYVTGDYVWLTDSDEVYRFGDLEKVRRIIQENPQVTQLNFIGDNFWKGYDYIYVSPKLSSEGFHWRRVFKFKPGAKFTTHRPPTMVWPGQNRTLEQMQCVDGFTTRKMGIIPCHYNYVLDQQVRQKIALYKNYGWEKSWKIDFADWYQNCFQAWNADTREAIEKKYPIWTGDKQSKSQRFTDQHPEVIIDYLREMSVSPQRGFAMKRCADAVTEIIRSKPGKHIHALETGTIRSCGEMHYSSYHIAKALGSNGSLISIDIDPDALKISRNLCYDLNNITYVESGSHEYLDTYTGPALDFVLLDSVNDGDFIFDEFIRVLPHLTDDAVLVVDDAGIDLKTGNINPNGPQRKGHTLWQFLQKHQIPASALSTSTGHGSQIRLDFTPALKQKLLAMLSRNTQPAQAKPVAQQPVSKPLQTPKSPQSGPVVIDTVIFQLQADRPGGISKVWASLLPELQKALPCTPIVLLMREGVKLNTPGIRQVEIPACPFGRQDQIDRDQPLLASLCKQLNARAFLSTYYTHAPGVENILMIHDMIPEVMGFDLNDAEWILKKHCIDNAARFICVSENTQYDLMHHYSIPQEKIYVAHNAADSSYRPQSQQAVDQIRKKYNLPQIFALVVGARYPYKNYSLLFEAMKLLEPAQRIPVVIAGSQPLSDQEKAQSEGLPIHYIGFVPDAEMPALYSSAWTLISPSKYEGFGLPILEAVSCGCPVLCTFTSSHPEVAGDAALYFPPDQPMVLAQTILLIEDMENRRLMQKRCLLRARKFSWSKAARSVSRCIQGEPQSTQSLLPGSTGDSEEYPYLVSAIVSTYASEKFIRGCLQDLVEQSLFQQGKMEIIIVDSASPENEAAIIDQYKQKYGHIKYIRTAKREGIYAAWNRGIKAASGKYITNANTDDRHHPRMLEILAAELETDPSTAVVYSHFFVTSQENQAWQNKTISSVSSWQPDFRRKILLERYFLGPQPMWRKSLHKEYGYFDPDLKVCGDYEFFLRVSQTHQIRRIPKILGLYLDSPESLEKSAGTKQAEDKKIRELYGQNKDTIVRRHYAKGPDFAIVMRNYNKAPYLAEAIECIQKQTLQNFQLIIVDDASTDESLEVIKPYLSDPRIELVRHQQNRGVCPTAVTGIQQVNAPYFCIFDSDDSLKPETLETMFREHQKRPECGFIYSQFIICDEQLKPETLGYCRRVPEGQTNLENDCVSALRTFKFRDYLRTEGHDCSLDAAEDKDIIYKMEEVTKLHFVDQPFYYYRGLSTGHVYNLKKMVIAKLSHAYAKCRAILRRSNMPGYRGQKSPCDYVFREIAKIAEQDPRVQNFMCLALLAQEKMYESEQFPPQIQNASDEQRVLWVLENVGFNEIYRMNKDKVKLNAFVTIYMPTYNHAKYIRQAVDSVSNQTYPHFELLIIDDGSTDETPQIIAQYDDPRIRYIRQEHAGTAAAINHAIEQAQSVYLLGLDSDDWLAPDYLEKMIEYAVDHPEYDHFYPKQMLLVDENGNSTGQCWEYPDYQPHQQDLPALLFANGRGLIPVNAGTLRTKYLFKHHGFYPEVDNPEDFVWLTRVAGKSKCKRVDDCPPYIYRRMQSGKSLDFQSKHTAIAAALEDMTRIYPPEVLCPPIKDIADPFQRQLTYYEYIAQTFERHAQTYKGNYEQPFIEKAKKYREKLLNLQAKGPIMNTEIQNNGSASAARAGAREIRECKNSPGNRSQIQSKRVENK